MITLLAFTLAGNGQRYFTATLASDDVLTDTDNGSYAYTTTTLLDGIYSYSVTVASTTASGSAVSDCYCQVSDDNTNWTTLETTAVQTDSLTTSAGTDGAIVLYNDAGIYSKHFRLYCNHTGTGVDTINAVATFRRLNK